MLGSRAFWKRHRALGRAAGLGGRLLDMHLRGWWADKGPSLMVSSAASVLAGEIDLRMDDTLLDRGQCLRLRLRSRSGTGPRCMW